MIPEPAEEAEPLHRAARFERHAGFYGVPAAALDQIFTWLGSAYRLSGCAARRCKFPFTAERVSVGKLVKFPSKLCPRRFWPSRKPWTSGTMRAAGVGPRRVLYSRPCSWILAWLSLVYGLPRQF
jgi:hypothetical protein